jgi:hypothetical protein
MPHSIMPPNGRVQPRCGAQRSNSPWLARPAFQPDETDFRRIPTMIYLARQARKPYLRIGVRVHRPPRFCVPASKPAPDPNRLLLSPARTPHSLPPTQPRPTSRPAPLPLPSLPLPLMTHSLPIPAPTSAVNPTGFAGTRRPAAPRPLNPHHWCDAPIAPFRQPPTDDRNPTSATSPTDKGLTASASAAAAKRLSAGSGG